MTAALHLVPAILQLYPLVRDVAETVADAMRDGDITAEEAEAIGRALGRQAGQLVVKVNGHDVVHGPATELIGGGFGRIARQVVLALRS
jgi:hypothetical protein